MQPARQTKKRRRLLVPGVRRNRKCSVQAYGTRLYRTPISALGSDPLQGGAVQVIAMMVSAEDEIQLGQLRFTHGCGHHAFVREFMVSVFLGEPIGQVGINDPG